MLATVETVGGLDSRQSTVSTVDRLDVDVGGLDSRLSTVSTVDFGDRGTVLRPSVSPIAVALSARRRTLRPPLNAPPAAAVRLPSAAPPSDRKIRPVGVLNCYGIFFFLEGNYSPNRSRKTRHVRVTRLQVTAVCNVTLDSPTSGILD